MSATEEVYTFGCGCTSEAHTGIPLSTCRRHDQRTREVKASAALMQLGNELDEAGKELKSFHTREAAKYAVKAAKALIGADDAG